MDMLFELTPGILDEIIFAMEDQHGDRVVDVATGRLRNLDSDDTEGLEDGEPDDDAKWVSIPSWTSRDGFNLMERFVDSVHNPGLKKELCAALSGRQGVFRRFKEALRNHENAAVEWYRFKDENMRRVVTDWHRRLGGALGAASTVSLDDDLESDEAAEIVAADYSFSLHAPGFDAEMATLSERPSIDATVDRDDGEESRSRWSEWRLSEAASDRVIVVAAREPADALVGYIAALLPPRSAHPDSAAEIANLFVVEHHRGLGLARNLVQTLLKELKNRGFRRVIVTLPSRLKGMGKMLSLAGFRETGTVFTAALDRTSG